MSIDLCVLASGSSGNCTVLRTPQGVVLIDAGIGPRTAATRLAATDVSVADVSAVCLTHLDSDHINPNWFPVWLRRGVSVYCHDTCVDFVRERAGRNGPLIDVRGFGREPFALLPSLVTHPLYFAHDQAGSHGFVFEGFGTRVGYATDLGHVPDALIEQFPGVNVLAIESNYDSKMQINSPRPAFLKRRIMGGRGHLSNDQAFAAVRRVLDRCEKTNSALPQHIVLLHRSRQCNCPHVVRKLFTRDARIASRLVLAEQDERTAWLRPRPSLPAPFLGQQLELTFC